MSDILENTDPFTQPSFTLVNRIRRALWGLIYSCLFLPTPRTAFQWRAFLLRLFGASIGNGCNIHRTVRIWAPWNLVMLDQASMANDVICYSIAKITIGKKTVISQGAHLCSGSHDYESPDFHLYALPIIIGDTAWLCADCFIAPGVTIGEGAVIGARSVVTKDMPPWMVCAGNPCKPIKPRIVKKQQ